MKPLRHIEGLSTWMGMAVLMGAFCLFQVQPIISKAILPWFGGSPAVWTTCLLFFQVLLLAGYGFAEWLHRYCEPRRQAILYLGLTCLALLTLPILPGESWKPRDGSNPTGQILLLLVANLGLPYFLLATFSPLVQVWFARVSPERSPYPLYALSNLGSLTALVSYPFLVEPAMTTRGQSQLWSVLYFLFAVCCAVLALRLWRLDSLRALPSMPHSADEIDSSEHSVAPSAWQRMAWVSWPLLSCMLLMTITNHLCQDLAVVPLLWILPLSLYLITYIVCFASDTWYFRSWIALGAALLTLYLGLLPYFWKLEGLLSRIGWPWPGMPRTPPLLMEGVLYLTALFLLCMVCHGELVRQRPTSRWLTQFYFSIAAGGAIGGVAVAVICPLLFSSFIELPVLIWLSFLLALAILFCELGRTSKWRSRLLQAGVVLVGLLATSLWTWGQFDRWKSDKRRLRTRNFYGVLSVEERYSRNSDRRGRVLMNGRILHGYQRLAEPKRKIPTTYYSDQSGIGLTLRHLQRDRPIRVGVVGLGVGTIAAYGQPGDIYRFYEINPRVVDVARQYFSFLSDSDAATEIVLGDARLMLDQEPPQNYDVLALDAFSGDAIPVHLLTYEAMRIYMRHLAPDGVLAVHISNQHLNLAPVILELAHSVGASAVSIRQTENDDYMTSASDWILLTRDEAFLSQEAIQSVAAHPKRWRDFPLWTDQYHNLLHILHPLKFLSGTVNE